MRKEKSVFYLEFKKFTVRRNVVILATIFVLSMLISQLYLIEHNEKRNTIEFSSKLEQLKAKQFDRYSPYGVYGIHLVLMPSPMSFLSTLNVYGCLSASIDSGVKLKIYESKKDKNIFGNLLGRFSIGSLIILLFGSLLSCIYGHEAFRNEKYLKFICCIQNFKMTLFKILAARMAFISLFVLFLFTGFAILTYANGFRVINKYYALYILVTVLTMIAFLLLGAALGALKRKKMGLKILIGGFIVLNFIAPWMIAVIVNSISDGISELQTEYDKLKILMTFEKRGIKKFGADRSGKNSKTFARSYLDNELRLTEDLEKELKQKIIRNIQRYQALSSFFPSAFYLITTSEISAQGFNSYIAFYEFALKAKRAFIEFYADKKFSSKGNPGKVESFIKGDENILYAQSSLPANFGIGIGFTLFQILCLTFITYRNARKKIYPLNQKLDGEDDLFILIRKKEFNVFFTTLEPLKEKIYNHLAGKEKLKGEINLDTGKLEKTGNTDFVYLVDTHYYNDIKPAALHQFLLGKPMTENMENWEILFQYALQKKLTVMDGFLDHLSPDKVNSIKLKIKETGTCCLVITSDYYLTLSVADAVENIYSFRNEPAAAILKKELDKRFVNTPKDPEITGINPMKNLDDVLLLTPPETESEVEN